jgi:hypothetical protein
MGALNHESENPSNRIEVKQIIEVNPNQPQATNDAGGSVLVNQGQSNADFNVNDTRTKQNPTRQERIINDDGFYNHSFAG